MLICGTMLGTAWLPILLSRCGPRATHHLCSEFRKTPGVFELFTHRWLSCITQSHDGSIVSPQSGYAQPYQVAAVSIYILESHCRFPQAWMGRIMRKKCILMWNGLYQNKGNKKKRQKNSSLRWLVCRGQPACSLSRVKIRGVSYWADTERVLSRIKGCTFWKTDSNKVW